MSKTIDKLTILYPVKLYYSAKRYFTIMAGCLLMGMLGYFVIPLARQDEAWVIVAAGWLLVLASIFGFIVSFYAWFKKKPAVIIEKRNFSFFNILKRNQQKIVLLQDIVNMDLTPWTHGHITHWMLSISIKSNTINTVKIMKHPLKPMYLEGLMLNEKEVFHLLEQAFEGKTVLSYKRIDMRLRERLQKNFSFWFTVIVLIMTAIVALLFVFL